MSLLFSRTLIRSAVPFSAAKPRAIHRLSSVKVRSVEADAKAVEKIEDVIHTYIVKKSKPSWLPFVPGASYWVPPRRTSYGVAEFVNSLSNALTDEENLSLISLQGWPSSAFYIRNDVGVEESQDLVVNSTNELESTQR